MKAYIQINKQPGPIIITLSEKLGNLIKTCTHVPCVDVCTKHTHTTNCTNKRLCHANSYMVLLLRRLKTRLQGNEKLTCGPPKNQTMFG